MRTFASPASASKMLVAVAAHNSTLTSTMYALRQPTSTFPIRVCWLKAPVFGPVVRVRNNVFANFTGAQTGSYKHYIVAVEDETTVGPTGSIWDYNDYYLHNTTNGFVGKGSNTDFATLNDWRNGSGAAPNGTDAHTLQVNPLYSTAADLHVANGALNNAALAQRRYRNALGDGGY